MKANICRNTRMHRTRILSFILATAAILSITMVNCVPSETPTRAQITYLMPPSGIYYPGENVTSYIRLKNTGKEPWTFWVGYSIQDQAGNWYDIASNPVMLEQGAESPNISKTWQVPAEASCITGYYTAVTAVWDARPEDGNATRIAERKQQSSFQVLRNFEQFNDFNTELWDKSRHRLENSYLNPKNVDVNDGYIQIRIPAGTLSGGEFSSTDYFTYGTYRTSMMVPYVPCALTGFFLYGGANGEADEIDIEIYNDGNWQIEFTTWIQGVKTNTSKKLLNFDPTSSYHEYRIDFYPQEASFFVDNQHMESYTTGLPTEPMKLLVNTWFPRWLSSVPPTEDMYTRIDWIQY